MSTVEEVLKKIARQLSALNEENLTALLPKYKKLIRDFKATAEWEEAIIIYFLINSVRIKNTQFNENVKQMNKEKKKVEKKKTIFKLIK